MHVGVEVAERDHAGGGLREPAHEREQRALAEAAAADDQVQARGEQLEVDALEHRDARADGSVLHVANDQPAVPRDRGARDETANAREREAPRRAAGGREKPAARPPRAATPRRAPADAEAPIACSRPLVHAGAERARGERDAIARRDDAAVV